MDGLSSVSIRCKLAASAVGFDTLLAYTPSPGHHVQALFSACRCGSWAWWRLGEVEQGYMCVVPAVLRCLCADVSSSEDEGDSDNDGQQQGGGSSSDNEGESGSGTGVTGL